MPQGIISRLTCVVHTSLPVGTASEVECQHRQPVRWVRSQQFLGKERVPLTPGVERAPEFGRRRSTELPGGKLAHLLSRQWPKPDGGETTLAPQFGERPLQRHVFLRFPFPVRSHQQQACRWLASRHVTEEIDGRVVTPLQIIKQENQWAGRPNGGEKGSQGLEEPQSRLLGRKRIAGGDRLHCEPSVLAG